MITKVITSGSNQNGVKYGQLFNLASEAMGYEIGTLNKYFQALPELIKKNDQNKPIYLRLPIDEDFFEINANTREIKVPSGFKSGIGVQGDQAAETIFFIVDRYFDTMDLNNQNIYIEWKSPTRNGFSKEFARDIISQPNKIIFGWVLQQEIMEAPGQIEFAVRFYTTEQDPQSKDLVIKYSLSTKPQKVSINKTLNFSLIDGSIDVFDAENLVTSRITQSTPDSGEVQPESPVIIRDIEKDDIVIFNENGELKGYFKADEDYISTLVNAYSRDGGALIYNLEFLGNDSNEWVTATKPIGYLEESYEITDDESRQDNNSYYQKYEKTMKDEENILPYYSIYNGEFNETEAPIYEHYAKCYFGCAGKYRVSVKNRKNGNITADAVYSSILDIPYPIGPTVNEELQHIFFETENPIPLTILGLEVPEKGVVSYKWFKNDEEIKNANGESYEVPYEAEGIYKVTTYNTLNKVTQMGQSCTYKVTCLPDIPKYSVHPAQNVNYPSMTELSVEVIPAENKHADCTYVTWYKAKDFSQRNPETDEIVKEEAPIVSADNNKSVYVGVDGQYYAVIRNEYNDRFSESKMTELWTIIG